MGIMTLVPEGRDSEQLGLASFTCGTDNQGNMYLVDKLLTTKYPLGVVLMEGSYQLGRRRAAMRANWIPRLQNEEADALTNSDFHNFSMERRIDVNLDSLPFIVLNEMFAEGKAYVSELQSLKEQEAKRKAERPESPRRVKRPSDKLKEKDPW